MRLCDPSSYIPMYAQFDILSTNTIYPARLFKENEARAMVFKKFQK